MFLKEQKARQNKGEPCLPSDEQELRCTVPGEKALSGASSRKLHLRVEEGKGGCSGHFQEYMED